jgi:hypothetical protein
MQYHETRTEERNKQDLKSTEFSLSAAAKSFGIFKPGYRFSTDLTADFLTSQAT